MKRVVIIGGGITGLAAAHRLVERQSETKQEIEVTLVEGSSRLGGIVQTEHRDGFLLEHGPDSFISEKPEAISLARRVGLESELLETNSQHRRSFVVRKGRLRAVPEGFHLLAPSRLWPFITSDIFSLQGKARMLFEFMLPRRKTNGNTDESLAEFVCRRLGREALDRMAQPMVGGIYTSDPERLSLRATFPRFVEMEREHGSLIRALRRQSNQAARDRAHTGSTPVGQVPQGTSGARYSLFLTFDHGMQTLSDRLQSVLPSGMIRLNVHAVAVSSDSNGGWTIKLDSGESLIADALCVALPAYAAASLVGEVDSDLATELVSIPYESTATVNLAYRREDIKHPLDGFGFVVPFVEKRSLMACTFASVKFAHRAPEGSVLLRAFVGGALQPDMFALNEAEMTKRVQADLKELLGIAGHPLFTTVAKWRHSMPQYHLGHLERIRRIEDFLRRLPTLKLAGNAYRGVGIPDCIKSGEQAADEILALAVRSP